MSVLPIRLEDVVDRIVETDDGRLKIAFSRGANWYFVLPEHRDAVEGALRDSEDSKTPVAIDYVVPGNVIVSLS